MTPEERVLNHYSFPYHRHLPPKPGDFSHYITGEYTSEICEDHIRWWGRISVKPGTRILGLWWEGKGCCLSQAMASMLAEHCEARRVLEVLDFTQDDMVHLIGVDFDPGRLDCVLVAYRALLKALERHRDKA